MPSDVTFRLDAENAKALRAFTRMTDEQRKSEVQFKRTTRAARRQDGVMTRVGKTLGKMGAGMIGTAGIVAGLSQVARGMEMASNSAVEFDAAMTELISLGRNVAKQDELKQEVLDLSTAWDQSARDIAMSMFNIESGAANLSKEIQREIRDQAIQSSKFYGSELPSATNLLVKTMQIYGDQVKDVADAQSQLNVVAERGAVTGQQLATQFPDLAAAAKAAGITFDELSASIIVATQRLGKTEKTFTGLRGTFLKMAEAEKKGIELTGTLENRIAQLAATSEGTRLDLFGAESIAAANTLVSELGQLRSELANIETQTRDTFDLMVDKLGNANALFTERERIAKRFQENIVKQPGFAESVPGRLQTEFTRRKVAIASDLPPFLQFASGPLAGAAQAFDISTTANPLARFTTGQLTRRQPERGERIIQEQGSEPFRIAAQRRMEGSDELTEAVKENTQAVREQNNQRRPNRSINTHNE